MSKTFTIALAFLLSLLHSCSGKHAPQNGSSTAQQEKQATTSPLKLESPLNGSSYTTANTVDIRFTIENNAVAIDSTVLSINGKRETAFTGLSYSLPLTKSKMGMQLLLLTAYKSGVQVGTLSFVLTVKPQHPPKMYTYKVVKEYPHSKEAYTQGLFFHNNFLYEGTGLYGNSTLRKVDLQTGSVLHNLGLDKKYFGEGICLLNNRIYQLTWQEHAGFVYDAASFEKTGEFSYPTEGWGITSDGTYLIMSDGSANLYFINPENMTIVKQVEVYSNDGPVAFLNELEYINGEVWANIYGKDSIAVINAETGELRSLINLKGILKQADYSTETDVLNGIAYDSVNNRIFVTGKKWTKLFEIKIEESR